LLSPVVDFDYSPFPRRADSAGEEALLATMVLSAIFLFLLALLVGAALKISGRSGS
jgi:hypothetical protein